MVALTVILTVLSLGATLPAKAIALPRDDAAVPSNGTVTYYSVYAPEERRIPHERRVDSHGYPCGNWHVKDYPEGSMCCSPDESRPATFCFEYQKCTDGPRRQENGNVVWGCVSQRP